MLLILNFESLSKILLHFTSTKKYNYESQLFYKWGVVVFFLYMSIISSRDVVGTLV